MKKYLVLFLLYCLSSCHLPSKIYPGEVASCPVEYPDNDHSLAYVNCETLSDPDSNSPQYRSFTVFAADPIVQKFVQKANDELTRYESGWRPSHADAEKDIKKYSTSVTILSSSLNVPKPNGLLQLNINNAFLSSAEMNLANIYISDYNEYIRNGDGSCQYPERLLEEVIGGNRLVKFPDGLSYSFGHFWVNPSHTVGEIKLAQAIQRLQTIPFAPMAAAMNANTPFPPDASAAVMYHDVNDPKQQLLVIFEKLGCAVQVAILNPSGLYTTGPGQFLMMPNEFILPISQ